MKFLIKSNLLSSSPRSESPFASYRVWCGRRKRQKKAKNIVSQLTIPKETIELSTLNESFREIPFIFSFVRFQIDRSIVSSFEIQVQCLVTIRWQHVTFKFITSKGQFIYTFSSTMSFNLDSSEIGPKILSNDERKQLEQQNSRLVPEFKAKQLEENAKKHWDLFYKRNDTRFFKDRHWTTREFNELISNGASGDGKGKRLLEVGCGVGNFVFPLIEDNYSENFFIYACDFSPRAIEFVKENPLYDDSKMFAFQCDITTETVFNEIERNSLDLVSMIFVLSAIHPEKFTTVLQTIFELLKPGGVLLFRDYGLYDMAQIRFKAGNKIAENFYVRQDGTRSYYFGDNEMGELAQSVGFEIVNNSYIHRKTINVKENIDKPRIFVQGKFRKPTWPLGMCQICK